MRGSEENLDEMRSCGERESGSGLGNEANLAIDAFCREDLRARMDGCQS